MDVEINKILLEWSYRVDRGFPRITKEEDLQVLDNIITELYDKKIAETLLENIEASISEVSLGLNNSSLRHENEHKKYTKRLIKKLKSGGTLTLEREVQYTEESEEDSNVVTIPEGGEVKVDVSDDLIGKLVAGLRGVLKYGPDFPEENEKAQKALKKAEKVFTKEDGSYRRIIPVKYKDSKVLIKLSDVSKSTVTDEDEGQDTDFVSGEEDGENGEEQDHPKQDQSEKDLEEVKRILENETSNEEDESRLPDGVVEFFGDSYSDGPENPDVMEEDDDDPSKYVDRRDDGKDDKYPDRGYKEFDPKSDEEEEESDDDYRHDKGNEENPPEDEEAAEQDAEETLEEEVEEKVNKIEEKQQLYRFNIKV